MKVMQLHKLLTDLIERGHAHKPVRVQKDTFSHNCELDGAVILDVVHCDLQWIPDIGDDGGIKIGAKGQECGRTTVVLRGGDWAQEQSQKAND